VSSRLCGLQSAEWLVNLDKQETGPQVTINYHRCDKRQKIIINVNKRVYWEKDCKRL